MGEGEVSGGVVGERWIPLACGALVGALALAAGSAAWDAAHRGDLERIERRSALGDAVFALPDGEGVVRVEVGGVVWTGRAEDAISLNEAGVDRTEWVDAAGVRIYSRKVKGAGGWREERVVRLVPGKFVVVRPAS
jgi:hypothetical protein